MELKVNCVECGRNVHISLLAFSVHGKIRKYNIIIMWATDF